MRDGASAAARTTMLTVAGALALVVTVCFLCAAAFVFVLQNYGLIEACLTGALTFLVVAALAGITLFVRRRRTRRRSLEAAKSAPNPFADPMLLLTGLQVARAIGFKKVIPLLALGGIALGLWAARQASADDTPDQPS